VHRDSKNNLSDWTAIHPRSPRSRKTERAIPKLAKAQYGRSNGRSNGSSSGDSSSNSSKHGESFAAFVDHLKEILKNTPRQPNLFDLTFEVL